MAQNEQQEKKLDDFYQALRFAIEGHDELDIKDNCVEEMAILHTNLLDSNLNYKELFNHYSALGRSSAAAKIVDKIYLAEQASDKGEMFNAFKHAVSTFKHLPTFTALLNCERKINKIVKPEL